MIFLQSFYITGKLFKTKNVNLNLKSIFSFQRPINFQFFQLLVITTNTAESIKQPYEILKYRYSFLTDIHLF